MKAGGCLGQCVLEDQRQDELVSFRAWAVCPASMEGKCTAGVLGDCTSHGYKSAAF